MWYVHTMEYYSAIKRNDILIHVTILINPENIMLSERTQTQKATYYMTPFILNIQDKQIHRDGMWMKSCQGLWGWENGK